MFNVFKKVLDPKAKFTDEDISKVNDFVFCRWLSGLPQTIGIAQTFNFYDDIPIQLKLLCAQKIINGRIKFIPYPKGSKKNDHMYADLISQYYNVSKTKANMYLEFISEDEMKHIESVLKSKK